LELQFATKKFIPQINLPFPFLIQKYFFRDNPTWNINNSEWVFPSRYSEYLLLVKGKKRIGKQGRMEFSVSPG